MTRGRCETAMKPIDAGDAMDAAFDRWLRMDLRARYGAVAAAPVPHDLLRIIQDRRHTRRTAPAAPSRPRTMPDSDPVRGLAVALVFSGLFWTALAAAVWAF